MTDTGKYRTTSFCVDPGFNETEEILKQITSISGLQRSTIIRTIIHDRLGTMSNDPDQHECNVKKLNKALTALGRK